MNRRALLLVVMLTAWVQAQGKTHFTSSDEGVSLQFPYPYQTAQRGKQTQVVTVGPGGTRYLLILEDMASPGASATTRLGVATEALVTGAKMTVKTRKDLVVQGCKAKDLVGMSAAGHPMQVRCVMTPTRFCALAVQGQATTAEVERFFGSLQLNQK